MIKNIRIMIINLKDKGWFSPPPVTEGMKVIHSSVYMPCIFLGKSLNNTKSTNLINHSKDITRNVTDSKSFSDINSDLKPLQDSNFLNLEGTLNKIWNWVFTNKRNSELNKYNNFQSHNINSIESIKEQYNRIIKSVPIEKKEWLKYHYDSLLQNRYKFQLDLFTDFVRNFYELLIVIIKKLSEFFFQFNLPYFKGIIFLEYLPIGILTGNFIFISMGYKVISRMLTNKIILRTPEYIQICLFTAGLLGFGFTPYIHLSPYTLYIWFIWLTTVFLANLVSIAMNNYSKSMTGYITEKFGTKIDALIKQNLYITINPQLLKLKRLPFYKLKFQIICLKNNFFNQITVEDRTNPSLSDQIQNILKELDFYVKQRQLFKTIINRVKNKEENFYDDDCVGLFTQYIDIINNLIDELESRKENLIIKLKKENEDKIKKEDEKRGKDYYDDFYG